MISVATIEIPASRGAVDARAAVARARKALRARSVRVGAVLAVVTFVVFCVSMSVGDFPIPLADVLPAIFGFGGEDTSFIVHDLRLPRALAGLIVGVAFGFSGAIFQSIARNALASPDILGFTAGASTAAVFMITVIGGSYAFVSLAAFLGGLVVALLVYMLAWRNGMSPYRLVLIGIGVGAAVTAGTEYLLTRASLNDAASATVWLTGSLNSRGWESVNSTGLALAVLIPAVLILARQLRVLQLGDDTARGLGVGVERYRLALVLVGVALAGVGVAAAGPVTFVAFVAPPIARRLTRAPGLSLIPAALVGGLLVLASDLVGRRLFAPTEIPVGIITGIVGAPYLLWLLARANRVGRGG